MDSTPKPSIFSRPGTISLITALILGLIGANTTYLSYQVSEESRQVELNNYVNILESNLEQFLSKSTSAALMLAFTIDDHGKPVGFDSVSNQLLSSNQFDVLELLPDGVIQYVYPVEGNESVIGYNILTDSTRSKEALRAMELKQMYFAGPIALRQGGEAILGRLPVYIHNQFWGFAAVITKKDKFLQALGADKLQNKDLMVQLSKVNPNTGEEEFFMDHLDDFPNDQSMMSVVQEGDWNIYVGFRNRYASLYSVIPLGVLSMLLAIIGGFFVLEILKKPTELRRQLDEHNKDLQISERKYRLFFENAAIGVAQIDSQTGQFMSVNERLCEILGYTKEELESMKFSEITHQDDLEMSRETRVQILKGEVREFKMEKRYLSKRGTPVNVSVSVTSLWKKGEQPTSVLVLVEDVSSQKDLEQRVLESSIQAQEIEKNKIASEIHDGIVQEMVACSIHAESLEEVIQDPEQLQDRINALVTLIKKITNDTRSVSHNLLSADVSNMSLVELLTRLETQLKNLSSIDIRMEVHLLQEEDLSQELKTNIYRVVQELTTNIIKHSNATFASITVEEIGDEIFVTVRDNGQGMQEKSTIGIGTYTIRNRINKIGGTIQYHHPNSGGLEVSFSVPIS